MFFLAVNEIMVYICRAKTGVFVRQWNNGRQIFFNYIIINGIAYED